jgi:excisionase family DNA binding protein
VPDSEQPLLISVREASRRLGVGRDATYDLARRGALRSIRVGRRVLIPVKALEAWIDATTLEDGDR